MQEDQQEALNQEVETETTISESPAEDQTADVQTDVSIETPVVPKKGAQSRIRELSGENRSLKEKIAELTSPVGFSAPEVPYMPQDNRPLVGADEAIDANELERRMQQREQIMLQKANQLVDFRSRQNAVIQQINSHAEELVNKYEELNPESDSFNEELNNDVFEIAKDKLKADPTADIRKLVAKQVALHRRAASKEEKQTQAVITKQAAQSAIRPSQTKTVDTPFEKLSIDEMRSKLGYAQ